MYSKRGGRRKVREPEYDEFEAIIRPKGGQVYCRCSSQEGKKKEDPAHEQRSKLTKPKRGEMTHRWSISRDFKGKSGKYLYTRKRRQLVSPLLRRKNEIV